MAAVAREQIGAERLLELVDLVAQRRLGDVEACGGAAEVELLGDGEEVAQQTRLEIDRARLSPARDTGLGQNRLPGLSVCCEHKFRRQKAENGDEYNHGHEP